MSLEFTYKNTIDVCAEGSVLPQTIEIDDVTMWAGECVNIVFTIRYKAVGDLFDVENARVGISFSALKFLNPQTDHVLASVDEPLEVSRYYHLMVDAEVQAKALRLIEDAIRAEVLEQIVELYSRDVGIELLTNGDFESEQN
jgi:hypothetical protein